MAPTNREKYGEEREGGGAGHAEGIMEGEQETIVTKGGKSK